MRPTPSPSSDLQRTEQELRAARKVYKDLVQRRNALVLQAIEDGMRPGEVAKLTGLTSARIAQLQH